MKNVVAYCRVSTNKDDQINSFEAQKAFFAEYAERYNLKLLKIYADEGITGTSTKKRAEFNQMMTDSESKKFDTVLVKDVSRLARNTVDLLQSIRKLKSLNIDIVFITADMTTLDNSNSELIITMLGAVAQEESVNMSKRVKFGKQRNAAKGRVPNLCYGYIKTKGDYFNLKINDIEADIVKEIFDLYVNQGYGTHKISKILNNRGLTSLRGVPWTITSVGRILKNKIYAGYVINQKVEVKDIFTQTRRQRDKSEWIEIENPDLQIIPLELWEQAQKINEKNNESPMLTQLRKKRSNRHLFSTLITCPVCGYSFRRFTRKYKSGNTVWWGCSGRNHYGVDYCHNATIVNENALIEDIDRYFATLVSNKDRMINDIVNQLESKDTNKSNTVLESELATLKKKREKQILMYEVDIISIDKLQEVVTDIDKRIEQIELELKQSLSKDDIKALATDYYKMLSEQFTKVVSIEYMTNAELKQLIKCIVADENENVQIELNVL